MDIDFGLSNSLAILLYGSMMYIIAPGYQFHWHLIHDAANRLCYQFHCHFLGQNTHISITISLINIHCRELIPTTLIQKKELYLNTGASDDAHEKVRNNTGDCHHKALHTSNACKEHEHKVNKVVPTRMQLHHEVNN